MIIGDERVENRGGKVTNKSIDWPTTAAAIMHQKQNVVLEQCMKLRPSPRVHYYLDRWPGKFQIKQLAALLRVSPATVKRVCVSRNLYPIGLWHYNMGNEANDGCF